MSVSEKVEEKNQAMEMDEAAPPEVNEGDQAPAKTKKEDDQVPAKTKNEDDQVPAKTKNEDNQVPAETKNEGDKAPAKATANSDQALPVEINDAPPAKIESKAAPPAKTESKAAPSAKIESKEAPAAQRKPRLNRRGLSVYNSLLDDLPASSTKASSTKQKPSEINGSSDPAIKNKADIVPKRVISLRSVKRSLGEQTLPGKKVKSVNENTAGKKDTADSSTESLPQQTSKIIVLSKNRNAAGKLNSCESTSGITAVNRISYENTSRVTAANRNSCESTSRVTAANRNSSESTSEISSSDAPDRERNGKGMKEKITWP